MPPTMTILDPQAFTASALASSEGRAVASRILESCLAGPEMPLDLIVQDLCSVPHLFEFVVSTLPSAKGLVHKIMNTYPTNPAQVEPSCASTILERLSSFIFSLPPDLFSTETSRSIGRYKFYVENAFPVVDLLRSPEYLTRIITDATRPMSPLEVPDHDDDEEDEEFCLPIKKQKKIKRKNKNNVPTIDIAPFHRLGVKVPLSNAEATKMADDIAAILKMILKFYLGLLSEPSLSKRLEGAYVSVQVDDTISPPLPPQGTKVVEAVEPMPSAYPMIQPLKAALYFDNAEGFGEWRIIIGSDATRNLRQLANGDRRKCEIVVKKIKQLSNGHFSEDNQKRLNGSSGVPIFEAKMQRDLRLVYQIDVATDRNGEVDRQVIKIYGIYTHTQVNRIWDAVGRHLAGKGRQYQDRCTFRNRPVHGSGDVYLPASFPPEALEYEAKPTPLVVCEEDMEKLHSLLVLDKYIAFSQGLLHSLIANRDTQHVFELSPYERRIAECTTSCFVLGRSGTGKTTTMLFKMIGIQRAWEHEGVDIPKPRQIFVTKSRVLATKVEEYFSKLLESSALAEYSRDDLKRMRTQTTESGMFDIDDIERVDIPQKYSALEESHFPLFVTFDQLAKMIAEDVLDNDDPEVQRVARFFKRTDETEAQDSLVTYETFARTYWSHFPQPLTKGLEPWLVFSEFIGIIKGSEKSLSCPGGVLDEETYCTLPARSNPVFANERRTLYALFKVYNKLKQERRHHDAADRTYAILKRLLDGTPLKGKRVTYLYVDEAQDNLLIDALLLRILCQNPEGLFWAGDTAQTISAGSSFRFNDLKAFVHRIERDQRMYLLQDRSVHDPVAFQLTINYRSHGGIVNCAHSVIERITRFWPDTIDGLQAERGVFNGAKPFFFRGWGQEAIKYEQFLFGELGDRLEFGANQCIIVRDKRAVDKLREEVGEIGVIMTLYDSKGLEFNDVLLYNFFEDSAIDVSRWKVLLNYTNGIVDSQDLTTIHAPSFERDEGRFAGVCSELKSLYVGITRARKNLWIFDKSEKSDPMRIIWASRDQVETYPKTNAPVPRLAMSSTPEEWEYSANVLFKHKKYQEAMHCFTRASLPRMVDICEAFYFREEARNQAGVVSQEVQRRAFRIAADAFMKSAKDAPAGKDKLQYYRNAAECYVRANDHRKAADSYLSGEEYTLAARHFRKAGLFNETFDVLHMHSEKISSETSDELLTVCRLFYCSKNDGSRPRSPLFPSYEEELKFLEDYDLDFARATLLESHGKYMDAAKLHLAENRPLDAIKGLLKDKKSHDAMKQATEIVLESLWRRCSFAVPLKEIKEDQDVIELLKLACELPAESLDSLDHDEISMFRAIAKTDLASLEELSQVFIKGGRHAAALLALDHFFSRLPVLKSFTLLEMSQFLDKFREYVRLVHSIISHTDPLGDDSTRRLFCIAEISNTEYGVTRGSFLHNSATEDRHGVVYLQPSISKGEMVTVLQKYLAEHLRRLVVDENESCCEAPVFLQCLTFIVTGQCNRINCPQEHVKYTDLDSKRYNIRIGIHLQQICILQMVYSVCPRLDTQKEDVLDWLLHVYEAFNPQSHLQGSTADLNLSMIPGALESLGVMKHWIRGALYALDARLGDRSKSSTLSCIRQAPFNARRAWIPYFMYSDECYVLEDVVSLFDGSHQTCISSGLKFLKHVIKTELFVDLSVFCDCLEEVIGKISVSWRLSYDPPLDGLVLPRGWLSSNKDFSSKKDVRIGLLVDVLDCVQELLMRLQSDAASRLYTLSHTKLTPVLCNMFISRICRALCFLAYNVRNIDVKQKVKKIFESLQTRAHYLYGKYAHARDNEYLRVMTEYDAKAEVVIADLVQLLHKRRSSTRMARLRLKRIEDIEFTNPSDIPSLLTASLVVARSDLRADAPTFVPRISQIEKAEDEEKVQPEEPEQEPLDDVHEESQELPLSQDEPVLIREHEPTEEEIGAAIQIQSTYRRYRNRREVLSRAFGKGLKAQRNTTFVKCLKNVYTFGWGKTPYRTLYLWALPRLVVCLDKAITIAHESKGKLKGRLLKESHERLEELGKQTSNINALLKRGRDLRKKIEPNADMHKDKDRVAMKQAVMDVTAIVHGLPSHEIPKEIQDDLDEVYQLVMVEKQYAAKPEKPTLNTEDLVE